MKRFLITLAVVLIPCVMFSQAQITTKKMKLEDFPEKTTKIVLSGNIFLDGEIEDAVKNQWTVSPYEFCTMQEFEELKGSDDYYFLITVLGQFKKESEPGLEMLSLVKGGKGADAGIDRMLEVITVPVCSSKYPSGREISFISPLIDIIQEQVQAAMLRDINAYAGLQASSSNMEPIRGKRIVIAESDINTDVDSLFVAWLEDSGVEVLPDDEADALMDAREANTIVSYTVSPYEAGPGSFCYKMLIDTQTHKLYYYRKSRITKRVGPGFLSEELARVVRR